MPPLVDLKDIAGLSAPLVKLIETVGAGGGRLADGVSRLADIYFLAPRDTRNNVQRIELEGGAQTRVIQERVRALASMAREELHLQSISIEGVEASFQLSGVTPEVQQLHERAQQRMAIENAMQQLNREAAVAYAMTELASEQQVSDEPVDPDWITRYFRNVQDISREDAQLIFGKILAGEVKKPGTFSVRTIDFLATLTKEEGEMFRELCSFVWQDGGNPRALLFSTRSKEANITFPNYSTLRHLDDIGLIALNTGTFGGYISTTESLLLCYGKHWIEVKARGESAGPDKSPIIDTGIVLLTGIGAELAQVCQPTLDDCIMEYTIEKWIAKSHAVSCPFPAFLAERPAPLPTVE